jgi:hypothetical protein
LAGRGAAATCIVVVAWSALSSPLPLEMRLFARAGVRTGLRRRRWSRAMESPPVRNDLKILPPGISRPEFAVSVAGESRTRIDL